MKTKYITHSMFLECLKASVDKEAQQKLAKQKCEIERVPIVFTTLKKELEKALGKPVPMGTIRQKIYRINKKLEEVEAKRKFVAHPRERALAPDYRDYLFDL